MRETAGNPLIIAQDNRIQGRPYLPTVRCSPRKESTNDRPPLSQAEFRKPKPRRNIDPSFRLSTRRQTCLSTQRQPILRYKGSRFKDYKGGEIGLHCRREFERNTRLYYIKKIDKNSYLLSADIVKITEFRNFFFLLLLYSPNPAQAAPV